LRLSNEKVAAIVTAAAQVIEEMRFADQAIERQLKTHPHWSIAEQGFVAEQTYALVRYYRLLYTLYGHRPQNTQEWEDLLGIWLILQKHPAAPQFKALNPTQIRQAYHNISDQRALRESIPDWLDELGFSQLGAQWEPCLRALNQNPALVLRANRLKTDPASLLQRLAESDIQGKVLEGDAVLIQQRGKIYSTSAFREGWFEVQDFSSQQVAPYLEVQPGMRVVDACAGNGGKTLHLAALMQNKGRIIALDTDAKKLEQLRARARRAGVSIIETRLIESSKTIKRLAQSADRVLLDVPCSGLGVLRRNPDTRWRLLPESLTYIYGVQREILERYTKMCRQGGKVVYATCSILPAENQHQIETYLLQPEVRFTLEASHTIWPQDSGFDGFYLARLASL
jgi:16S rRNA (cytosine967-C5)-methyltransferase